MEERSGRDGRLMATASALVQRGGPVGPLNLPVGLTLALGTNKSRRPPLPEEIFLARIFRSKMILPFKQRHNRHPPFRPSFSLNYTTLPPLCGLSRSYPGMYEEKYPRERQGLEPFRGL